MKRKILAVMGICLLCTACNKQDTKTVDVEAQSNIQKAIETTFNENCIAFKGDIVSTSSDEFASYSATIYKDNYTYSVKQNAEGFSVTDYSDGSSYYVYNSDGAYEMPIKCLDTNAKAFYLNTIKGLEWVATDLGYEATLTEPQVETIVNGYLVAQYNGIEKSSNDVVLQDYAKKATKYLSSDTYPSGTLTVLLDGGKLKAVILQYKSAGIQRIYSVEYKYDLESYKNLVEVSQPEASSITDYLESIYDWAEVVHGCDTYEDALVTIK